MGRKNGDCIEVLSLLKMLDGLDEQENMQGQGKCMHVQLSNSQVEKFLGFIREIGILYVEAATGQII